MRHTLPAPRHPNHDPWHPCAHPLLHRVALRVVLGGWLYWALVYGWRWGVMPSQYFAPDKPLLMWCVFGGLWFCLVTPLGVAVLYTFTTGKCNVPMPKLPPPSPRDPTHPCNSPLLHRLSIVVVLSGWLYWALAYGYTWAVKHSFAFGPGINLLMFCVFGAGWLCLAIPGVAVAIYWLMLGRCFAYTYPTAQHRPGHRLPVLGRRTTERIIFSPEAAQQRFGVRGTVIIERDREED